MRNNRLRSSLVVTLLMMLFSVSNCGNAGGAPTPRQAINPGCYQQFGVNLSGAEWDDLVYRPTLSELKYYSAKGVRIIRLPVRWERMQPKLMGNLNLEEINWLKSFIGQADKLHLTVAIDIHLRSQLNDLNFGAKLPAEALVDIWKKLAAELHNVSGICGYDIANEPDHESGYEGRWPNQANSVINAIRQVDTSHYIFVGEDNWDSSYNWNAGEAEQLKDPANMLVYEAHSYWDSDLSGNYDPDSPPKNGSEAKTLVIKNLAPFVNWCGTIHRCFVGEFGIPPDKGWLTALDDALQYIKGHHIAGTYWAGGPGWGDNPLSIEPNNGTDRPQMKVLFKYLAA